MNFDPRLPSPFYRVTTRALIFDEQNRLIVVQDDTGQWQLPGGGWEHRETFEECVAREVREELGVGVSSVSSVMFSYMALSDRGYMTLRLAARVNVDSYEFVPGDDMVAWQAVDREQFVALDIIPEESNIKEFAPSIWHQSVKVD